MQEKRGSTSKKRRRGPVMDKEAVKDGLLGVATHYAGPGKQGGVRVLFRCPGCGKPDKFAANPSRSPKIVGCLNGNCPVPKVMDALDVVAHFEQLDLSRDWGKVLAKGYEILGLTPTDGPDEDPRKRNGAHTEDSHETRARAPRRARPGEEPDGPKPGARSAFRENLSGLPALRRPEPAGNDAEGGDEPHTAGGHDETRADAREPEEDAAHANHAKESTWTVGGGLTEASEVAVVENLITVEPEDEAIVDDETIEDAEVVGIDEHSGEVFGLPEDRARDPKDHEPGSPELLNAVYRDILDSCPLDPDHREYLKRRGLSDATVRTARLGSMTPRRAKHLKERLVQRYGKDLLLSVPGFSEHPSNGGLRFTLSFDCVLIPYHDADLNVTTLEGRYMGPEPPPKSLGKYVSLREGGNHVYVFPDHLPERLEAFCEGVMGALVAADNGIAVGSIMGFRRYRSSPGSKTDGALSGGPLLEIAGTDFRGRRVPYIPDVDDPPQPEVIGEAPAAARHLVERQNGEPAISLLPSGKDLDDWLLSMKRSERRAAFTGLVGGSVDLDAFEADLRGDEEPAAAPEGHDRPEDEHGAQHRSRTARSAAHESDEPRPQRSATRPRPSGDTRTEPGEEATPRDARALVDGRRLLDEVYGALLEEPTEEHLRFWDALGVSEQTVREGRFGSVSMRGSKAAVEDLAERFGAEALLAVPGFEGTPAGRVVFTLAGAAPVVPYRDGDGLITALVALQTPDDPDGSGPRLVHPKAQKDHLYVHPRFDASRIVAVCESPLQAILAAEAGFAVGAIAGPGRHRPPKVNGTLPELKGVDFGGRRVLYVPSLGAGEDAQRSIAASLAAAEALIARHDGVPVVAPQDFPGGFGRWILSRPEAVRESDLSELVEDADGLEDLEARLLNPAERAKRKASRNEARATNRTATKRAQDQNPGRGEQADATADGTAFVPPPLPTALPSKALITPGEALFSLLGAVLALWLFGRLTAAFPEAAAGYLSSMPSWADAPHEAALVVAGFAALWLWGQRSSIRRKRRKLRQGRIDH